jgi:hypothetical protein
MLLITIIILLLTVISLYYSFYPIFIEAHSFDSLTQKEDVSEEQISINNIQESLTDLELDFALEKISDSDFLEQQDSLKKELHGRHST